MKVSGREPTEVELAYVAVCEELLLRGAPEGLGFDHGSVCTVLRHAVQIHSSYHSLADAAVDLLQETRRRHPSPEPRGILSRSRLE